MAKKQYAYINSEMLKWARNEIPLELSDVSTRIKEITVEDLEKWEEGEDYPSISIAKKMATLYDIPFAALYLTKLPESTPKEYIDRRTISVKGIEDVSYELWKEIRYFRSCRENILSILGEESTVNILPKIEKEDNIDTWVEVIRNYFNIDTPLKNKTAFGGNVFNYFRRKIERKGIFVFQISGMNIEQIRGISLNYEIYPIIAVNRSDSERGKVFTLFHELAHLIRRSSALCSVNFSERNDEEEKICDKIAGNILVPNNQINKLDIKNVDIEMIKELSNKFGVSQFVILKRLYDEGKISFSYYNSKYEELYNNFMENKTIIENIKQKNDFRIPYHIKYINGHGTLFPAMIINAYRDGKISLGETCKVLNVKTKQVPKIEGTVMF